MEEKKTNRNYKDRVFADIFSEKKAALSLFNAVNGTDYTDIENLEIVTLSDALYMQMKNDVALLFHLMMNLFEQQSSLNPNMPFRGFLYFAREYEAYTEANRLRGKLYGSALVKIPTPKYYVIYNGEENAPERKEYRLSDAFLTKPEKGREHDYEWTATLININNGANNDILERCPDLKGYAALIDRVRENKAKGDEMTVAVRKAMNSCIEDNLLRDYLLRRRGEALNMILTEFDQKEYEAAIREESYDEGLIRGRNEGISIGRNEGRNEGRSEGITLGGIKYTIEIYRKFGKSDTDTVSALMDEFGLTESEAREKVACYRDKDTDFRV